MTMPIVGVSHGTGGIVRFILTYGRQELANFTTALPDSLVVIAQGLLERMGRVNLQLLTPSSPSFPRLGGRLSRSS
jgi:hypothetical protein